MKQRIWVRWVVLCTVLVLTVLLTYLPRLFSSAIEVNNPEASAAAGAAIESISAYGAFVSGGVDVKLSGYDGDETVRLFYKKQSEEIYKEGHPFVKYDGNHHASSLFDLEKNTTYDIRADLYESGTFRSNSTTTLVTRPDWSLPTAVRTVNVSNDTQFSAALSNLQPGDHVVLAPGDYTTTIDIYTKVASPNARIVFRSADLSNRARLLRGVSLYQAAYFTFYGLEIAPTTATGIAAQGSPALEVVDCIIREPGGTTSGKNGIFIHHPDRGPSSVPRTTAALILNNQILDDDQDRTGVGEPNTAGARQAYYGIKLEWMWPYSEGGVQKGSGGFTVIAGNTIRGVVDGIAPGGDEKQSPIMGEDDPDLLSQWGNQNIDIYDNKIYSVSDDCIETDGHTVNGRVFNNYLGASQNAFSVAAMYPGPYFILRNTIRGYRENIMKMNTEGTEISRNIYFYHNTFMQTNPDTWTGSSLFRGEPGLSSNIVWRNNINHAITRPISSELGYDGKCYTGGVLDKCFHRNHDFDYDIHWSSTIPNNGTQILFRWAYGQNANNPAADRMEYRSFEAFQQATAAHTSEDWPNVPGQRTIAQEPHGLFADPKLMIQPIDGYAADTYVASLIPTSDSPAIDAGVRIPGINDLYSGAAPDIGTYETEQANGQYVHLNMLLAGRRKTGQTIEQADHSHTRVRVELVNSNGTSLNPPKVSIMASDASGLATLYSGASSESEALIATIADNPGTTYGLKVTPLGYLPQTVSLTDANLNTGTLSFSAPFKAGNFSETVLANQVQLSDFAVLAAYFNGGPGNLAVTEAFRGRTRGSLLVEFAILASLFNSTQ